MEKQASDATTPSFDPFEGIDSTAALDIAKWDSGTFTCKGGGPTVVFSCRRATLGRDGEIVELEAQSGQGTTREGDEILIYRADMCPGLTNAQGHAPHVISAVNTDHVTTRRAFLEGAMYFDEPQVKSSVRPEVSAAKNLATLMKANYEEQHGVQSYSGMQFRGCEYATVESLIAHAITDDVGVLPQKHRFPFRDPHEGSVRDDYLKAIRGTEYKVDPPSRSIYWQSGQVSGKEGLTPRARKLLFISQSDPNNSAVNNAPKPIKSERKTLIPPSWIRQSRSKATRRLANDPVDLRPQSLLSAEDQDPTRQDGCQLATLGTMPVSNNIIPAYHVISTTESRSRLIFGKLPAGSTIIGSGPPNNKVMVVMSCRSTPQGYRYRGDLWPGTGVEDGLFSSLHTTFQNLINEPNNLAVLQSLLLSESLRRDPKSGRAHLDQPLLASQSLAVVVRTMISRSGVTQLKEYLNTTSAKPPFYEWHEQLRENPSGIQSKMPSDAKLHPPKDTMESNQLVRKTIRKLRTPQDLRPAAIWELGQGWVPLTMMNLINNNDENSEDPNRTNQSPKNLQRLKKHRAHRASRSGPTSRSPSPLTASTGAATNHVSRSNHTAAAPQKSSRHLEIPSATTSVYALQQPNLPSSSRHSNPSQYQDYSLSNNQQWRSPPGDQQTYSQEFQSFSPDLEDLGTDMAPYDQLQTLQMSNHQQYPQQSYHTNLTHRQANHPSDSNHQAISYEPFVTSIPMTQDASFNGLTQQQNYPPMPYHITPDYGFAAADTRTALSENFDNTALGQAEHTQIHIQSIRQSITRSRPPKKISKWDSRFNKTQTVLRISSRRCT